MNNQTFTNFSYNSPMKSQGGVVEQEGVKSNSMTPNIKSSFHSKRGDSLKDSQINRMDDKWRTQRIALQHKHNSLYQEEEQTTQLLRHINTSETTFAQKQQKIFAKDQSNHNNYYPQDGAQNSGIKTDSPIQNRSKKSSQQVAAQCLPNIFQDQEDYTIMRQQQQTILGGLIIDGKVHPINIQNGNKSFNLGSSRIRQHYTSSSQNNGGYGQKNKMNIHSEQHQDSQYRINQDDYNSINNRSLLSNHYRVERQAKSNEQRQNNNVKKAIKVSLQRNPALAASLDIYTNGGNVASIQQMSKVVQPYLMNQFLQKRKNLLQKKPNIHHSTVTKRSQNLQQIQGRQFSNNKNNVSYNVFNNNNNKSQILDDNNITKGNTQQNSKLIKITNNQNINSSITQINVQNSNITINKNNTNNKPTNLNALLNGYRSNSGGQRLLLQDFYNQQGLKDPDFQDKQQSLINQYNYSKSSLQDSAVVVSSNNKQNNRINKQKESTSTKENSSKKELIEIIDDKQDNHIEGEVQKTDHNHKSDASLLSNSYNQTYNNNTYGVFHSNQNADQSFSSSNMTQTITSNSKQNNALYPTSQVIQNNKNKSIQKQESNQDVEEQYNIHCNVDNITSSHQNINIQSYGNTTGQSSNLNQAQATHSPNSKCSPKNNNQILSIMELPNIPHKSADETLSPNKNSRNDKNQSIIHQRIVLQQQRKKGNSFICNRGGTFSVGGSRDPSFDLSIVNNITSNSNQNAINKFDFYESKSTFQQNMFSPPKIHKSKAVYVHSNTLNQSDTAKLQNTHLIEANNEEGYNFLNEEKQTDKLSPSITKNYIGNVQNDQILLIKSHMTDYQQPLIERQTHVVQAQKQQEQGYTCYFMKGNNSGLVRRVLLTRSNWKESPVYSSNLNFRWHPFSKGIKFESLSLHKKRIVNHFEFHSEITTKNGIIKNIGKYCRDRDLNVFDFTPCTFLFSLKDKFWDLDLVRFCDFFYRNLPEPLKCQSDYKKNVIEIKSKFRAVTIRNNQKSNKKKQNISTVPSVDKYGEMKIHSTFLGDNQNSYIWLLKPTNLNRGRGIELFSNLNQLETLLNNYFDGFYEQPIASKAQESSDKQAQQKQQDALLNIAMIDSQAVDQLTPVISTADKDKQGVLLHNLFDKSLYQTPIPIERIVEKGKPIEDIKSNKKQENNQNVNLQLVTDDSKNQSNQSDNLTNFTPSNNLPQTTDSNQSIDPKCEEDLQGSPIKNAESESDSKIKKQKIKKNKSSTSNHNVCNSNNNIHMARVRELSAPKKTLGNNQQGKQQNSPDKKGKNSAGISAEFGGYLMKEHSFVIQKYIEKPFLINERKFDIRMWVVVNQNMDVYLFKEGYIRTSSDKYDIDDQDNIFIHLTNNAIQKYSDNYGQYENGNQLSLDNFDEYLKAKGYKQTFRADVLPRIKEIITISLLSVKNKLNANDRKFSFEVFGYDFFIDQQFNVWLIEINTNPCIEESSPLLEMLIPRMIDDALKLTVDLIFPPQYSDEIIQKQLDKYHKAQNSDKNSNSYSQENSPNRGGGDLLNGGNQFYQKKTLLESLFPVKGYSNSENMFQFLVNMLKSN